MSDGTTDSRTVVFALGFATVVAQAVLLREAMAATGGSELAWGGVMALWLLGMGIGARTGVRHGGPSTAGWAASAVLPLAALGVLLFRAAPALLATTPGEAATVWHGLWLWAVAVLPAGIAGGIAFPALAGQLGARGGGRAYAWEAAGALAGGLLFSFALAGFGTAVSSCIAAGVVVALLLVRRRPLIAAATLTATVLLSIPAAALLAEAGWRWAGHPGTLGVWTETRHQRLEMAATSPSSLYADGRLIASYPDPYLTAPGAHLIMLLHPQPRRVYAVGCLADGAVEALLQHPIETLRVVEEDPRLLRLLPTWYGPTLGRVLAGPRVETNATEPLRSLRAEQPWDLIALRDGDPTTLRRNRTRSLEFFRACRRQMNDDGLLVVRLGVGDTYLGGGAGRLFDVMVSTLRAVFPQIVAVPGEQILLVAGGPAATVDLNPTTLRERWLERRITDPIFSAEMIPLLVDPARSVFLDDAVRRAEAPANTVRRPRAVLLASGLVEGRSQPAILQIARSLEHSSTLPLTLAIAAACCALLTAALLQRPPAGAIAGAVGLASMGWWLLLIGSWQATLGSVYAEIGGLTAAFMAGIAVGSAAAARWDRPLHRLPMLIGTGSLLSLIIASGAPMSLPKVLVPAGLLAGGLLTGAAFPGLAEMAAPTDPRRGAGIAFAADEIGAAVAALFVGVVALPWAGFTATALALALLQLAAIPAVVVARRRLL